MSALDFLEEELAALDARAMRRRLRRVSGPMGPRICLDGRDVLNFSSNDYLGLAGERWRDVDDAGVGAGASRLIAGNHDVHEEAERGLAGFHDVPAARLFNTGYQANIGVIAALMGPQDVIFSDALNHASIIDGCRLSRSRVMVYPHRDLATLRVQLRQAPGRRRLVVTESVFSMDGDRAPLVALAAICQEAGAIMMVDEAHAVGALGPMGRGLCAEAGLVPDVLVGTLGKAFGGVGAYVAGSHALAEWLINRARSLVFSTALPPYVVGGVFRNVARVAGVDGSARRAALHANIAWLDERLRAEGLLSAEAGSTSIFPLLIGDEARAMECTRRLLVQGIYVQGIRPPTVPRGTSRLRVTVMATHSRDTLEQLVAALVALRDDGLLARRGDSR